MEMKQINKGYTAEEALRGYFRNIGCFAVRGIPFTYKGLDITDVDLWLYIKANTVTSERVCVDIKNKRTPQAMERVLWARGLKEILGVDRALVATNDNRQETRNFGNEHAIGILQGDFLKRVITNFPSTNTITEEELCSQLNVPCVVDPKVNWQKWYKYSKTLLLNNLNFDGCNILLLNCKLLMDEFFAIGTTSVTPLRLLYIMIGYFLICLDFTTRSFFQLEPFSRASILINGFRYGESGQQKTREIVEMASQLLSTVENTDLFTGDRLMIEFERQIFDFNAEILGEYFSKPEPLKNLFPWACNFDLIGYGRNFIQPNEAPSEIKAIIGLLCDLWGYDRKKII